MKSFRSVFVLAASIWISISIVKLFRLKPDHKPFTAPLLTQVPRVRSLPKPQHKTFVSTRDSSNAQVILLVYMYRYFRFRKDHVKDSIQLSGIQSACTRIVNGYRYLFYPLLPGKSFIGVRNHVFRVHHVPLTDPFHQKAQVITWNL